MSARVREASPDVERGMVTLSEGAQADWEASRRIAQRGLTKSTCWEALGGLLVALAFSVVLIVGLILLWEEPVVHGALPLGAYVAIAALAATLPCVLLAFSGARGEPLTKAPRATERGQRIAAQAGQLGETGSFRNSLTAELHDNWKGAATLRQLFDGVVTRHGARPAQGTRRIERKVQQTVTFTNRDGEEVTRTVEKWVMAPAYEWNSYVELAQLVQHTGAGVWNALPDRDEGEEGARRIGIFADSSASWMQMALGAFRHGIPIVTVYATLGADAVAYAITQTGVSIMSCDAGLLSTLTSCVKGRAVPTGNGDEEFDAHCRSLRTVVYFGEDPNQADVQELVEAGIEVLSLAELQAQGAQHPVPDTPDTQPTPDSIANIQYTSGSTGLPKGVVIHHRNLVAAAAGMGSSVPDLNDQEVYMAYLPLAHILELTAELCILARGGAIGYGSKDTLVASSQRIPVPDAEAGVPVVKGDAAVLRPTAMAAVPAIMEKIRKGISAKVAARGPLVKALFDYGFQAKLAAMRVGGDSPFWNFLLFDKIRTEALGGRVRAILSGGGPLNKETQQFMNVVFCCPVGQGYGLTETMGAGTIVWPADFTPGTVGPPVLSADIKLVDWPEGGYMTTGSTPQGEVAISGPVVAGGGYWQLPGKTQEEFKQDASGRVWFHTGDIGEMSPQGILTIIDRKKDLVKLITGEYISLGKIESTMKLCSYITNIMAYGDGEASAAVAVVTPDLPAIRAEFPDVSSPEDAAASATVKTAILKDLQRIAKAKHFPRTETPSAIHIATEEWTPESDLVTASLKLKRKNLMAKYGDEVQALYGRKPASGGAAGSSA